MPSPSANIVQIFNQYGNERTPSNRCFVVFFPQFWYFMAAENHLACFEHLLDHSHPNTWYTLGGQLVKDSCCVAHMNANNNYPCSLRGIVLPFSTGLLYSGIAFVNFGSSLGFTHGGTSCYLFEY